VGVAGIMCFSLINHKGEWLDGHNNNIVMT
jgi:hypothetical protein